MKIAMLTWEYPPRIVGGISKVVYDLAQKLGERGEEVHVITYCEGDSKEFEKDKFVYVHRVRLPNMLTFDFIQWVYHLNISMIEYLVGLINKIGKFDIVHAHDWLVAYSAVTIKNSYCIPLVTTIHATENGRNNGIYNDLQRYISSVEWWATYQSYKVIVNSCYMQREVERVFSLPPDKVEIINNGICTDKFKGYDYDINFRRKYACDYEKIILFVGRLVNEKGVSILIDAMPKIISNFNDAKLVIVGKGNEREFLEKKAYDLGVLNKIYFTGYISEQDLKMLYKCVDVAVYPSLYEPFGIVALEAMLAGVPTVVSDVGGLGEIISYNQDGKKCYVGCSNSLADCVLDILKNPAFAEQLVINARNKVLDKFNWDILVEKYQKVYEEIISKSRQIKWEQDNLKDINI